jgi:hypothetical protein
MECRSVLHLCWEQPKVGRTAGTKERPKDFPMGPCLDFPMEPRKARRRPRALHLEQNFQWEPVMLSRGVSVESENTQNVRLC